MVTVRVETLGRSETVTVTGLCVMVTVFGLSETVTVLPRSEDDREYDRVMVRIVSVGCCCCRAVVDGVRNVMRVDTRDVPTLKMVVRVRVTTRPPPSPPSSQLTSPPPSPLPFPYPFPFPFPFPPPLGLAVAIGKHCLYHSLVGSILQYVFFGLWVLSVLWCLLSGLVGL